MFSTVIFVLIYVFLLLSLWTSNESLKPFCAMHFLLLWWTNSNFLHEQVTVFLSCGKIKLHFCKAAEGKEAVDKYQIINTMLSQKIQFSKGINLSHWKGFLACFSQTISIISGKTKAEKQFFRYIAYIRKTSIYRNLMPLKYKLISPWKKTILIL